MEIIEKILASDTLTRQLTGASISAFDWLRAAAFPEEAAQPAKTGRKSKLDLQAQAFLYFVYNNLPVTQQLMAEVFQAGHKSAVSRALKKMRVGFSALEVGETPFAASELPVWLCSEQSFPSSERINSRAIFKQVYPELNGYLEALLDFERSRAARAEKRPTVAKRPPDRTEADEPAKPVERKENINANIANYCPVVIRVADNAGRNWFIFIFPNLL